MVDRTGLTGKFDLLLRFTAGDITSGLPNPHAGQPPVDDAGLSILTAIQEQLGLKLEQ